MLNSVKIKKSNTVGKVVRRFKPTTMKMKDFKFNPELFIPMKTNTKIDNLLSSEGGMMKGTNVAFVGDPGVGKTTVLFMGDWIEHDPLVILKSILSEGWDSVLVDSFAELAVAVQDFHGGTMKNAETQLLNLFEKHNKGENQSKRNTNFMIIQQVTKGGEFAGSNRFKHMITAMAHIKFTPEGSRAIWFSKNRRGGEMNKLHFSLDQKNHVGWLFTEPMNGIQ